MGELFRAFVEQEEEQEFAGRDVHCDSEKLEDKTASLKCQTWASKHSRTTRSLKSLMNHSFLESHKYSDFTITAGAYAFKVHKVVISCGCEFLNKVCSNGFEVRVRSICPSYF